MASLKALTAVVVLLAASGAVQAQQAKGDLELGFQGMYASIATTTKGSDESTTTSTGMLQMTFGAFVTNHLELGFSPMITIGPKPPTVDTTGPTPTVTTETGNKTTTGANVFATWSILANGSRVSPYVGMAAYKQDFSDKDDKGSFGVTLGSKFYVAPKAGINVGLNIMVGKRDTPSAVLNGTTVTMTKVSSTTATAMFQVGFTYLF